MTSCSDPAVLLIHAKVKYCCGQWDLYQGNTI